MRKIPLALAVVCMTTGIYSATAADKDAKSIPTLKESIGKVREECRADAAKLCKKVPEGGGRIASCLTTKRADLSDSCRNALIQTDAAATHAMDKADVQFRKSCGSDMQKYCAEVPSGNGRILDCLSGYEDDLSKSCKQFQAKLQKKVEELDNA